jgi:ATP-dependent DNA helicase RecG
MAFDMTEAELKALQEGPAIELKEAQGGLPHSVYETYSSFANTLGGTLYLGVKEMKPKPNIISGVSHPEALIADFLATLHNPSKTSLCFLSDGDIEVLHFGDKSVVAIHVPEAPRNAKPIYLNGNLILAYKRRGDGDQLLSEGERRAFLMDNSLDSFDLAPNAFGLNAEDIDLATFHAYREEMAARNPRNIFKGLSDEDALGAIGGLLNNPQGQKVLSNAAVLFFTSYPKIVRLFPNYLLDYRQAKSPSDKWQDRFVSDDLSWSGNLFDFYRGVYERILPNLPKPYHFQQGGDVGNLELQDAIKEALANALSNAAFSLGDPLLVLNEGDRLLFRNPGRIKVGLEQAKQGGRSDPRNSGIVTFFRLIGVADKAGTGIPRIFQAAANAALPAPLLDERADPEETSLVIFLTPNPAASLSKGQDALYDFVLAQGNQGASVKEAMKALGLSRASVSAGLSRLLKQGKLTTNGIKTSGKRFYIK